ncbi:hypothetical protein HCU40_03265 [Pseudanabaena biceps]|nr:hypothetical protein [Pseudanabaena biceps]
MTSQVKQTQSAPQLGDRVTNQTKQEEILCPHCLRTASNGIKCQGICVADSGY